jgi:hypothetical protein
MQLYVLADSSKLILTLTYWVTLIKPSLQTFFLMCKTDADYWKIIPTLYTHYPWIEDLTELRGFPIRNNMTI